MSTIYKIPLLLEPQPEGGYTVTSPSLSELVTEGDTVAEALHHVQDASPLCWSCMRSAVSRCRAGCSGSPSPVRSRLTTRSSSHDLPVGRAEAATAWMPGGDTPRWGRPSQVDESGHRAGDGGARLWRQGLEAWHDSGGRAPAWA